MKHLNPMGLCLVAMLLVSMCVATTASAGPVWEQCTTEKASTAKSKYTTDECTTSSSTGAWAWQEVTGTEEGRVKGSIRIADLKVPVVGEVAIECSGEAVGTVGPGSFGRVTKVETSPAQCRNIKNCEKIEKTEPRHLPWQGEIFDTEGRTLGVAVGTGGEIGWAVECRVLGVSKMDECLVAGRPESALFENKATKNGSITELLVLASAQHLSKQTCSVGGADSGEISGIAAGLLANGSGLRVS